jgi:hypothetical protein
MVQAGILGAEHGKPLRNILEGDRSYDILRLELAALRPLYDVHEPAIRVAGNGQIGSGRGRAAYEERRLGAVEQEAPASARLIWRGCSIWENSEFL